MMDLQDKENIQTILDCMTGADGGVSFVYLQRFFDDIAGREDYEARKIKDTLHNFASLIRILEK